MSLRTKSYATNGLSEPTENGHHINHEKDKNTSSSIILSVFLFFHRTVLPATISIAMPNTTVILWYTTHNCNGSFKVLWDKFSQLSIPEILAELWSPLTSGMIFGTTVILGYAIWALLLMNCVPGKKFKGPVTSNGNVPEYCDNGFYCYVITMLALLGVTLYLKSHGSSPTIIYDKFGEIVVGLNIFSIVLCIFLCYKGIYHPTTSDSGSTGNLIFDYYWGTELYPKIFEIDVKVFTNCRFGMTVWAILVSLFALKSYEIHGFVDSMFISTVLHLVYITKFFWWEAGYMHTIDITVDRAGFYICWGCISYIASLYTIASTYLVQHPVRLGFIPSILILFCGLASIYINYMADWQKQQVRNTDGKCLIWGQSPNIIRAKYKLVNGQWKESILLASGWWGMSRHFHYIPEILLAFFWTLPALFENLVPYSYLIFLTVLLVHRSFRDEHKCQNKYGASWLEYCRRVPYRIVPYLL